jgi:hypothetical protein
LYDFDLESIGRYLRRPARQPEYRQHRDHAAFVRNLPATAADLRRRLYAAWRAETPGGEWPEARVRQLVADKYGREEWVRRR